MTCPFLQKKTPVASLRSGRRRQVAEEEDIAAVVDDRLKGRAERAATRSRITRVNERNDRTVRAPQVETLVTTDDPRRWRVRQAFF